MKGRPKAFLKKWLKYFTFNDLKMENNGILMNFEIQY